MTAPPLPGGPLATIRDSLTFALFAEHPSHVDHNSHPSTCEEPGCKRRQEALTALDLLSELVRAAQGLAFTQVIHKIAESDSRYEVHASGDFGRLRRALLPFETSTEEGK